MPNIIFTHNRLQELGYGSLVISTGANQFRWGYNLNTQTFPTYGGEVVQILSSYTDNITITGTVKSYKKMEDIYEWFLAYMQIASQGNDVTGGRTPGATSYNQEPIRMSYPERGWLFHVHVLNLPGFRYGREVVAPEWQINAFVVDDDPDVTSINEAAALAGIESLHAGIGFNPDDPFSDPFAGTKNPNYRSSLKRFYEDATDYWNELIPKYMEGDYEDLMGEIGSKPAFLRRQVSRDDQERGENRDSNR